MKHSVLIKRIFLIAFAVIFLTLYINIAAANSAFDCFDPLAVIPLALLLGCALFFMFRLLKKHEAFLAQHSRIMLACCLCFFGIVLLSAGFFLRYEPSYDLGAIFWGGYNLAAEGNLGQYTEYFAMFSNNLGGLYVYTALFWVCKLLGITDLYAAALIMNTISLLAGVLLTFLCARRLLGCAESFLCLFILFLLPSFYTLGAAFYTDVLSLPYAAGAMYCYLRLRCRIKQQQQRSNQRQILLLACLCGLLISMGTLIKGTVVIVLIAILIDFILLGIKHSIIPLAACTASCIVSVLLLSLALAACVPAELAYQKGIPFSHWIAMSAHGMGTYDSNDYENAKALANRDERKSANLEIIARRYHENGLIGSIELWNSKLVRDFGNGTFSASDFLDDSPSNNGFMQQTVLKEGKYYSVFSNLCQGIYVAIMLFAAIGALVGGIRRSCKLFLPALCLFGLMLFLMFWEASARYVTNFIPFMLLAGAGGISQFSSLKLRGKSQPDSAE